MATNIAEANAKSRNAFLGFVHILFIISIGFSYTFWNIQFISIFIIPLLYYMNTEKNYSFNLQILFKVSGCNQFILATFR